MTSKFIVTSVDYGNEITSSNWRGIAVTAANFDAQVALIATLKAAIVAVIINNAYRDQFVAAINEAARTPPADQFAQREIKWACTLYDTVLGSSSVIEIGGADLQFLQAGSEDMDITAGVGLALANAIEAFHLSPAGNAVTVTRVTHVGRNI